MIASYRSPYHQSPIVAAVQLVILLACLLIQGCVQGDIPNATVTASQPTLATVAQAAATKSPTGIATAKTSKKPTRTPVPKATRKSRATPQPRSTTKPEAKATRRPITSATPVAAARAGPVGMAVVAVANLPPEAQHTVKLIQQGGPFPYSRDGIDFQNREGLLPRQSRSYYHEYTVITPGSTDRGARRIIAGANAELYYTDDHYASFSWIEP